MTLQESRAIESLTRALHAFPTNAPELLAAIENGDIDGEQQDAILKFLSGEDEVYFVASGQANDIPPIEQYVIGIKPTLDTHLTNEKLETLHGVVKQFIDDYQHELGDQL